MQKIRRHIINEAEEDTRAIKLMDRTTTNIHVRVSNVTLSSISNHLLDNGFRGNDLAYPIYSNVNMTMDRTKRNLKIVRRPKGGMGKMFKSFKSLKNEPQDKWVKDDES